MTLQAPNSSRSRLGISRLLSSWGLEFGIWSLFILVCFVCSASGQEQAKIKEGTSPVSFSRDIAPIFLKKCVTCHGPEKAKGKFQLHTFDLLTKGGESKEPTVVSGKPEQSKLFQLITAKDEDDRMPQKDDPL